MSISFTDRKRTVSVRTVGVKDCSDQGLRTIYSGDPPYPSYTICHSPSFQYFVETFPRHDLIRFSSRTFLPSRLINPVLLDPHRKCRTIPSRVLLTLILAISSQVLVIDISSLALLACN